MPNQNSFGHLRYFLEHPRLKKLARSFRALRGTTQRERISSAVPTTLAPNHPGTLPFLRGLYDELLPNFSSQFFNVGCDETWDLGRGQSKKLCESKGKGRVYLDFLKQIHREVSARGRTMMFWGDIILKYPKLIPELLRLERRSRPAQMAAVEHAGRRPALQPHRLELGLRGESSVCKGSRAIREGENSILRLPRHFDLANAHRQARQRAGQSARRRQRPGKQTRRHRLSHHRLGRRRASAAAGGELADVRRRRGAGLERNRF